MRRRVIASQFSKPTRMPDGHVKDNVNATPRKDLHPDRYDSYALEWDDEVRGLYVKVTRGVMAGKETLILGVHSVEFDVPEEPEIGKGKAGPGRGHKGPVQEHADTMR